MREKNVCKNASRNFSTAAILIFFTATLLLRTVNIAYTRYAELNEVSYLFGEIYSFAKATAVTLTYAFAVSSIFFAVRENGCGRMFPAVAFCGVIIADRTFCLVWDLATSNITLGERKTLANAVRWLFADAAYFAVLFFAAAFIAFGFCLTERGRIPAKELFISSGVLTVLQLVSRVVICIQFMVEYNDITATEYAQMAGDVLLVILRYGVFMSGIACLFYSGFSSFKQNRTNKQKADDKSDKM